MISTQRNLTLKRQCDRRQSAKPTQANTFQHSQAIRQILLPNPPMPKEGESRKLSILYRTYVSHRSGLGCIEADVGFPTAHHEANELPHTAAKHAYWRAIRRRACQSRNKRICCVRSDVFGPCCRRTKREHYSRCERQKVDIPNPVSSAFL